MKLTLSKRPRSLQLRSTAKFLLLSSLFPSLSISFLAVDILSVESAVAQPSSATSSNAVLDTILVTVDDQPITARDIARRLGRSGMVTGDELNSDPEAARIVERMIFEQVMELEAASRNISVSDDDINRYLDEVANRNGLSREGLEAAIVSKGRSVIDYRRQVKAEILQSRLGQQKFQASSAVSEGEVDKYIADHYSGADSIVQLRIARIFIPFAGRTEEEAEKMINQAYEMSDGGEDFQKALREFSEGPEAVEGGILGSFSEEELSDEIRGAIRYLNEGEISKPVKSSDGYQIFQLVERADAELEAKNTLREKARRAIQEEKVQSGLQDFFTKEIFKNHTIDKRY